MKQQKNSISFRDKQIICGLFLSMFDKAGLNYFGFESFTEAFNTLGYCLRAKPASIKNYRDEIDPYFPNDRKGWHKRRLRDHCKRIIDMYRDVDLDTFGIIIKSFFSTDLRWEGLDEVTRVLEKHKEGADSSFAKRLITGKAAEEYFISNYRYMPEFNECILTDTTQWGCGFDFKLSEKTTDSYLAVEVKGLRNRMGQIQMTDLEYDIADVLADRYFLVIVRNFAEEPFHNIHQNPLRCPLDFTRLEKQEVRVSWVANVT